MNNVYKFVGFPEKDGAGYWLFVSFVCFCKIS